MSSFDANVLVFLFFWGCYLFAPNLFEDPNYFWDTNSYDEPILC